MAPSAAQEGTVYSATYSNVPVYELNVKGNHVMRRRSDDWINATHILKVADLDKPARTRVLEKEVQLDVHEKVQGGYGKYQGTWIPMEKAELLAKKYEVYHLLRPILEFKLAAGDRSPPPAPKHTTASSRNRQPKQPPPRRSVPVAHQEYDNYEQFSEQIHEETPDNSTIASDSIIGDEHNPPSRKRKRANDGLKREQEHRLWADSLLDYFMLHEGDNSGSTMPFPEIPAGVDVNRPIDNEGHTALHWAAAMGDVEVVKDLLRSGANMEAPNIRGETPLIRAAMFANCYDRGTWAKMVYLLQRTITVPDNHGGTVFHHIAHTAMTGARAQRARHYLDVLMNKLKETATSPEFYDFLNTQDRAGDTAFHIASRNSRRCTKAFQHHGLPSNIQNNNGETVDQYLQQKVKPRHSNVSRHDVLASSSPIQGDRFTGENGLASSPSQIPTSGGAAVSTNLFLPHSSFRATSSRSFTRSLTALMSTGIHDFLQAGEADLADKDRSLADSQRSLDRTDKDLATTRQKIMELKAKAETEGGSDDVGELKKLEQSHSTLVNEALRLEEQVQQRGLHQLVREEESRVHGSQQSQQSPGLESERARKLRLARSLAAQQQRRVQLVREIVDAAADAGMGPRGDLMKGIIVQTLGVSKDALVRDVDALLEHMETEAGLPNKDVDMAMEIEVN